MKVSKLEEFVRKHYICCRQKSLILLGPPGVGKSYSVINAAKKLAKEMDREFIMYNDDVAMDIMREPQRYFVVVDLRLTELQASDLIGVPRADANNQFVRYVPLLWARVLATPGVAGILFLDELTNVDDPSLLAAAYKITLDRAVGMVKLSDDVMVVAAGNKPEHSAIANELPTPLVNRLVVVEVEKPTVEEWLEWATSNIENFPSKIVAYLLWFKEDLMRLPTSPTTTENYPTPRSWAMLAEILAALGNDADPETVLTYAVGLLGREVGTRFYKFWRKRMPTPQELLKNPDIFSQLDLEEKVLAAAAIGQYLGSNLSEVDRFVNLIETIANDSEELLMVLIFSAGKNKFKLALQLYRKSSVVKSVIKKIAALRRMVEEQ